MPLRDHFRPPLDDWTAWENFHAQWPAMIVLALGRKLPRRFVAGPRVHAGVSVEVDVGALEMDNAEPHGAEAGNGNGGVATAVWAPPRPTVAIETDLPAQDDYEVRIYDSKRGRRLVAAIEIVSPANKDRPEHRRAFVAKCAALLQEGVATTIVDFVTTRNFNLYHDLLELMDPAAAAQRPEPSPLYAVACRGTKNGDRWLVEAWEHTLTLGQLLPTLPLWLADNLAIPLELEPCYEDTCRALRIP